MVVALNHIGLFHLISVQVYGRQYPRGGYIHINLL